MNKFTIRIIETLAKDVVVLAKTEEEAQRAVENKYYSSEIVLDSGDYVDTEFEVV